MRLILFYLKSAAIFIWIFLVGIVFLPLALVFGNSWMFPVFIKIVARGVLFLSGVKLILEGRENFFTVKPAIYVGNHQSNFDVATFCAYPPNNANATFVIKDEARKIPIVGRLFKNMGVIFLSRKNREKAFQELEDAAKQIRERKLSLGMMPEGTRNLQMEGFLPFKKGAFHLAILSGAYLVPMISSSLKNVANFREKKLGGTVILRILEPVSTKEMSPNDVDRVCAEFREKMLVHYHELNRKVANL